MSFPSAILVPTNCYYCADWHVRVRLDKDPSFLSKALFFFPLAFPEYGYLDHSWCTDALLAIFLLASNRANWLVDTVWAWEGR